MVMYVNGAVAAANGSYAYARNSRDVYVGDYALDYADQAFIGGVDYLRTSDQESDVNLLTAPAIPEPTSLAALASGLMCSIAALRRKRK